MKKVFIIATVFAIAISLSLSLGFVAFAENENQGQGRIKSAQKILSNVEKHLQRFIEVKDKISDDDLTQGRAGISVLITPSGQARVTSGIISSLASSSAIFNVKAWGHEYVVMTDGDTKFVARGQEVSFADLKVGDKVDVGGSVMMEAGHEGHLKARIVRNRAITGQIVVNNELCKRITGILEMLLKITGRTVDPSVLGCGPSVSPSPTPSPSASTSPSVSPTPSPSPSS